MEHLYKEHYRSLYLFALSYLDSEDEASDVVAGVFETVWQQWRRKSVREPTASPSFLFTLTKNRCVDVLRRDKARRHYASLMRRAEAFDTTSDVSEYEQSIVRLRQAISRLPEPGRSILTHCYFKRMSYQETADHLELSIVVVRKNMLKVFKILRETLKNSNEEI
mgnify:CR=1 FL=1